MSQTSTLQYYQENASNFIEQTINVDMQAFYNIFVDSLPDVDTQVILDVGCGSGRDSGYFANCGYKVIAFDGSKEIIKRAKHQFNAKPYAENIQWSCLSFDQVKKQNWTQKFTGIWACASLLHAPREQLEKIFNSLLQTLVKGGVLYASFKYGNEERVQNKRLFCDMNEELWAKLKSNLTTEFEDSVWITEDKRPNREELWFNVLLKL